MLRLFDHLWICFFTTGQNFRAPMQVWNVDFKIEATFQWNGAVFPYSWPWFPPPFGQTATQADPAWGISCESHSACSGSVPGLTAEFIAPLCIRRMVEQLACTTEKENLNSENIKNHFSYRFLQNQKIAEMSSSLLCQQLSRVTLSQPLVPAKIWKNRFANGLEALLWTLTPFIFPTRLRFLGDFDWMPHPTPAKRVFFLKRF